MKFAGIYTPVLTPYMDDGSIDTDGFITLINFLLEAGVHGLIINGTTGEYYAQSTQEKDQLVALAKTTINHRVPLVVGIGAIRTEDCIANGETAKRLGADAILMPSPFYALPSQQELANHALMIDRAVDLPIMLYNYPGRTGTLMGTEFFDIVGRSRNFQAIKESSGSIDQLHALARDYRNISLLCGMDDQALEYFAWGASGWVCGGSNCLPEEHIALYNACVLEKDFAKGRAIMMALMPFMRILEQSGKFIQSIKHAARIQGLPAGVVRKPLQELGKEGRRDVETVVKTLKATIKAIA